MADEPQPGSPGEPEPFDPFAAAGFDLSNMDLAQLMRILQSPGPVNWEIARQVAGYVALGDPDDPNIRVPDPTPSDTEISELQELARAAEGLVATETAIPASLGLRVRVLGRATWADLHLDALKPVLESLAVTLRGALADAQAGEADTPPGAAAHPSAGAFGAFGIGGISGMGDPFGGLLGMLAPVLLGMQAGSMVGYLAQHALGRYDLPLPTADAPGLVFVAPNLAAFEDGWSIPRRDLRFYVALHEAVHAAMRSRPWVQERLLALSDEYVRAYDLDVSRFEEHFGALDPSDPSSLAGVADRPEELLGAMQSEAQREIQQRILTLTTVMEGYGDVVLERIGTPLLPDFGRIHEAMARHHVERGEAERFIGGLLGLKMQREDYERGREFCRGVVERAGPEGLHRLWTEERMLPTPAEIDAPGLWLARIDLPED